MDVAESASVELEETWDTSEDEGMSGDSDVDIGISMSNLTEVVVVRTPSALNRM